MKNVIGNKKNMCLNIDQCTLLYTTCMCFPSFYKLITQKYYFYHLKATVYLFMKQLYKQYKISKDDKTIESINPIFYQQKSK